MGTAVLWLGDGEAAAAHQPAQPVLVEVGDDAYARAGALGVEQQPQRAAPRHVEPDVDAAAAPAGRPDLRDPTQQIDGGPAERRAQRHGRARGQSVARRVEEPACARARSDQVEHDARRGLDPLLGRQGQARHHIALASDGSVSAECSAAALASSKDRWNSSWRKRITSWAGPVLSTE